MKFFTTLALNVIFVTIVACQSSKPCCQVTVYIKDSLTNESIKNAKIKPNSGDITIDKIQETVEGEAVFKYMKPKVTNFTITADGYQSSDINFNIQANNENDSTFYLQREPNLIHLSGKVTNLNKKGAKGVGVILSIGNFTLDTITTKGGKYSFIFDLSKFTMESIEGKIEARKRKCKKEALVYFDSKEKELTKDIRLNCKPNFLNPKYSVAFAGGLTTAIVYGCQALEIHKTWNENLKGNNGYDINNEYDKKNEEYKCRQKGFWTGVGIMCVPSIWYCVDRIIYNHNQRKIDLTTSSNSIGLSLKF